MKDFEAKNASKYPTTFASQPSTRPSYIKPTTTYNGRVRNVEYNASTGSYGFFDDLGKFMVYSAITDVALDAFKDDEKVYVQKTAELDKEHAEAVAAENDSSWGWILGLILSLILAAILGVYLMSR